VIYRSSPRKTLKEFFPENKQLRRKRQGITRKPRGRRESVLDDDEEFESEEEEPQSMPSGRTDTSLGSSTHVVRI